MEIIFYHPTFDTQYWICELEKQLPGARVREWKAGDNQRRTMPWSGIRR
ncbi:hypothetical protein NX009_22420 [Klebsiella pneumoniae]|nr:hypothetical protein [Klebsiella pneumoniae]